MGIEVEAKSYLSSSTVRRTLGGVVLIVLGHIGLWAGSDDAWNWREFIAVLVAALTPAVLAISGRRTNAQQPLRLSPNAADEGTDDDQ